MERTCRSGHVQRTWYEENSLCPFATTAGERKKKKGVGSLIWNVNDELVGVCCGGKGFCFVVCSVAGGPRKIMSQIWIWGKSVTLLFLLLQTTHGIQLPILRKLVRCYKEVLVWFYEIIFCVRILNLNQSRKHCVNWITCLKVITYRIFFDHGCLTHDRRSSIKLKFLFKLWKSTLIMSYEI